MTTTQRPPDDLAALIDASFGDGPEHRPVQQQLAGGRRALHRRRLASAVAGLAVVAAVGSTYAVVATGDRTNTEGQVATDPSAAADPTTEPAGEPWQAGEMVRAVDGTIEVRPDAQVHQRITDPAGPGSLAVDLTYEGNRGWTVALLEPDGLTSRSTMPVPGTTFREWAIAAGAEMVPQSPPDTPLLRLSPDGQVEAAPGVRILQRTDDPQLGESFAPPGAPTGAALLRPEGSDETRFVEWRVIDGELDVVPLATRDLVGATFEELLAYAREQNSSGEGLR